MPAMRRSIGFWQAMLLNEDHVRPQNFEDSIIGNVGCENEEDEKMEEADFGRKDGPIISDSKHQKSAQEEEDIEEEGRPIRGKKYIAQPTNEEY